MYFCYRVSAFDKRTFIHYKVEGQVMPSGIGSLHGIIVIYASSERIYTYTI